jgi:hypothetical protein
MTRTPTSNTWSECMDQIGMDYADGLYGFDYSCQRLMRDCDLSATEAIDHLLCFTPPEDEEAVA